MARRVWLSLAALPLLVLALWFAIGERDPRFLPLPDDFQLSTTIAATAACLGLSAALALCAWRQRTGLIVLGIVLIAIGVFWPSLQGPRLAGPVLVAWGSHGIHQNDWWGLVPVGLGIAALAWAWHSRPRRATV